MQCYHVLVPEKLHSLWARRVGDVAYQVPDHTDNNNFLLTTDPKDSKKPDWLWKIQPLFNKVRAQLKSVVPDSRQAVDEMKVPFKAKTCPIRVHMKSKLHPWRVDSVSLIPIQSPIWHGARQFLISYFRFPNTKTSQKQRWRLARRYLHPQSSLKRLNHLPFFLFLLDRMYLKSFESL